MKPRLTIDCPKHGPGKNALPVIDGMIRVYDWENEWPADVTDPTRYRRVCVHCVAEAMVQPIRRSA